MTKGRRKNNVIDGMHGDMLVVAILTAIQSFFGIPWLVAATVRSLSHVGALSKFDKNGNVEGTIEQRVTVRIRWLNCYPHFKSDSHLFPFFAGPQNRVSQSMRSSGAA